MNNLVININVGGISYSTSHRVLTKHKESTLYNWFKDSTTCPLEKDAQGQYFLDRDGSLFRFILDFLRNDQLILPANFKETSRLREEAKFYGLTKLEGQLNSIRGSPGYITVGYQGSFSFGRQGLAADVNFRKISRILVCGKVSLCREVFGETLNEGRDPDKGEDDRYSARFFLKHSFVEQAFDALKLADFHLVSSCASGTSGTPHEPGNKSASSSTEEDRWAHYNEFVFCRY